MKNPAKEILVNQSLYETRVALLEGGRLAEFYIERPGDKGLTGNIYKGRVVRVLPGMQAAFVDIGLDRTAFLHITDIHRHLEDNEEILLKDADKREPATHDRIQDILKTGQDIMFQVEKEPIGSKGARITSNVSLPGRQLVLMPTFNHIGISRRIENEKERKRLRAIVESLKPDKYGFIVRTACEDMNKDEIKTDMYFLIKLWEDIQNRYEDESAPSLIYSELDLSLRTVRDLFGYDVDKLIIDSKEEYEKILGFVDNFLPGLKDRVEYYSEVEPLFDIYGVEIELTDALEKKVWLKSGGFIVIDQMEALTAIDVNTGKYVGRKSSEETILRTNLEAVKETVYQLRLRNIGGIIVIDFIDMDVPSNREKVYNVLKEAIKIDKARTNILKISELGIAEMTRERVRASIAQLLCEPCPYCEGNGTVKAKDTIIMEIYRELLEKLPMKRRRKVTVYVNPAIADRICGNKMILDSLEKRFRKRIVIKTVDLFHQEQHEIT
jgi:ribonuclease G